MKASFWHQRWEKGEIAFHKSEANPLLIKHFAELNLVQGSRIFLPLCGKTKDIAWLLANGYQVVGAELSPIAVDQLFQDLEVEPEISKVGKLNCYHANYKSNNIDVFVGDIFDLSQKELSSIDFAIDAIYDRAALVALPPEMRDRYSAHLTEISNTAPQLLICFEYDQHLMDGPPFSIDAAAVKHYYQAAYDLNLLERKEIVGGLKGLAATETIWLLQKTARSAQSKSASSLRY